MTATYIQTTKKKEINTEASTNGETGREDSKIDLLNQYFILYLCKLLKISKFPSLCLLQ